jgi:hypothetical protein
MGLIKPVVILVFSCLIQTGLTLLVKFVTTHHS